MRPERKHILIITFIIIITYLSGGLYFAFIETDVFEPMYGFPVMEGGDSYRYALLAENLLEHKKFTSSEIAPYSPEIARSPGYSFFLVPFKFIFDSFVPVIFAQIILIITSALLIYKMGSTLFSEKIGIIAALLFSFSPAILFYTFTILSDILFIFLFLLGIYILFFKPISHSRYTYTLVALAMIILGYATLVRPVGLYSIIFILLFLLIHYTKYIGFKRSLLITFLSFIVYASVLAPWYIRNYYQSDALVISSTGPYTLLFYNVAGFLAQKDNIPTDNMKDVLLSRHFLNVEKDDLYGGQYLKEMKTLAINYIKDDPIGYFTYHGLGSINFFIASSLKDVSNESAVFRNFLLSTRLLNENNVSIKEYLNTGGIFRGTLAIFKSEPLFTLERLAWLFMAILVFLAPILFWDTKEKRVLVFLFFFLIIYFALIFGPVSYARYRISAEPFIIILAIGTLWKIISISKQKLT